MTMAGEHYAFTKEYYTGIESIDKEHARLFEIANRAYELLTNQFMADKYDQIVAIMTELRDYTKTHFAHEEEYMMGKGYQHRWSQKVQHLNFIKKLMRILCTRNGQTLFPRDELRLSQAVDAVMKELPAEHRGFGITRLLENLTEPPTKEAQENGLRVRLSQWAQGGEYGWVFDNDLDTFDMANATISASMARNFWTMPTCVRRFRFTCCIASPACSTGDAW